MEAAKDDSFEDLHSLQRSTILRVYNYYRILISFVFLFLFLDENFSEFVGTVNPQLFENTILAYILINILIALSPLIISEEFISKTAPSFAILIIDIIALTLLMSASGGVSSGLGNFLIFTVAFGGGLIFGRISTVLPAIAFILTLYTEFYLFFLDENEVQSFFQAGILGIVYFVANIFFQSLSQQLRRRETEVFTLEQVNQIIVDQMHVGVTVVSKDGDIKLINASGERLLYPSGDSSVRSNKLPVKLLEKIQSTEPDNNPQTLTMQMEDDSPSLLANFSTVETPDPDVDVLIFLEDSTEVQRQAQQLKLAALGRLSASIAHEIQNPLGAISHAAQLLGESTSLDQADKRLSEIIQNHCIRMNSVIENVLQMSRRKTSEPKPLKICDWIRDFIDDFSAGFPDGINVEFESDAALENLTLEFDPLQLSQVLGNLCQNGLRYSEKHTGEPKLKIRVNNEMLSGISIEVIDYGQGVSEDLTQNLFEPFYTTETSGTGLGLYLSRELCESNMARLSYSRADTGGSCFRISFTQPMRQ